MTASSILSDGRARRTEVSAAPFEFTNIIRKAAGEPLAWFALASAIIFLVSFLIGPGKDRPRIELTENAIREMEDYRSELLGRKLTDAERAVLIGEHVDAEVLIREAVARNLHLVDPEVRRRLAAHMRFLLGEDAPEPTSGDLAELRDKNPEKYLTPPTVTFEHIFFPKDEAAAATLIKRIRAGEPAPARAGSVFWLGRLMESYTPEALKTVLGPGFVNALSGLSPGNWSDPIRSRRGWHLVRVIEFRNPEPLPEPLMEQRLKEDWIEAARRQTSDKRLSAMRGDYEIVIPNE